MNELSKIDFFKSLPISFEYQAPSKDVIRGLFEDSGLVTLNHQPGLILDSTYFKAGHKGTSPKMFARQAVAKRVNLALEILRPQYGILVFDVFRTLETQKNLFQLMVSDIQNRYPHWSFDQVHQEAKKYMVDPSEQSRYAVPPHNSGGAIDLALTDDGTLLDFGSGFDDPSIVSSTLFFESEFKPEFGFSRDQWEKIRQNRRILFHTMVSLGFTNYPDEWWHYDLGDCMWAEKLSLPWIFNSLESEVANYERLV